MDLKTVKKDSEMSLAGCTIIGEWRDGALFSATITDATGAFVRFSKGEYSTLVALVQAPPKMVDMWRIEGELKGLKFREDFDSEYAAECRLRELEIDDGKPTKVSVPETP